MSQLSLYLDDVTMLKVKTEADARNCSLSKFVASLIEKHENEPTWPKGYWDLYGCMAFDDFQAPEELPWTAATYSFDDFALREDFSCM